MIMWGQPPSAVRPGEARLPSPREGFAHQLVLNSIGGANLREFAEKSRFWLSQRFQLCDNTAQLDRGFSPLRYITFLFVSRCSPVQTSTHAPSNPLSARETAPLQPPVAAAVPPPNRPAA